MGDFNVMIFNDDCHEKDLSACKQIQFESVSYSCWIIYTFLTETVFVNILLPRRQLVTISKYVSPGKSGLRRHLEVNIRILNTGICLLFMLLNSGMDCLDLIYYLTRWYQLTM